jgi:hypothetical protein
MVSMGLEAECTVRVGRKISTGTAQLEGERLIFRGDFRLEIPFEDIRSTAVEADSLIVSTADHESRFELGAGVADRWIQLIKQPKGLFEKLEIGLLTRAAVVDIRDTAFLAALRRRAASVAEGRVPQGAPVIFFGVETKDALRKIQLLRARMTDSGVLWLVRQKGSKAVTETEVYQAVRAAGLVDTKVVAFSKTHTAHKCVIPLELRGRPITQRFFTAPPSTPALESTAGKVRPKTKAPKEPARPSPRPAPRPRARKGAAAGKAKKKNKKKKTR